MSDSTPIIGELGSRRVFCVYRAIREPDGKINKIPLDVTTGYNVTAHDPRSWLTGPEATLWASLWAGKGPPGEIYVGVGLVLTAGCGVFCLDLDHGRDANGGWLPHIAAFCNRFPGAALETSVSGTGRHVFLSYTGDLPPHGVDNRVYRMQAYSQARFIGLTGTEASGSILSDHTETLKSFLAEFFPVKPAADHGNEWTTEPVEEWKGPSDDAELIRRAIRSVGLKGMTGGGAAFSDLWGAQDEMLAKAFPSERGNDVYNRSAADIALSNHLAFWTGNDCERMLKLMRESGLRRDKYDRPDYLPRTILNSTGTQHEWYAEKEVAPTTPTEGGDSSPAGSGPPAPPLPSVTIEIVGAIPPPPVATLGKQLARGEMPAVGEYANITVMKQLFDGMCYVQDNHTIQLGDGSVASKERFDARFGGPKFAMTSDGQKPTKSAWDAFTLSEIHRFPRVDTQYFRPDEPLGTIRTREGHTEINLYRPAEIRRVAGDPAPFIDLLRRMLPNGRDTEILLCYMAACVQNLGKKFAWAPFIQGTKGNGKTSVGLVMEYCMSFRYTHWAKADQIGEKFNSVFVDKLLVIVDEMYSDDARELQEALKLLVTAKRIEVRPMRAEKTMKEICFNMMLFSNWRRGVRIDRDERRYAPLFCAQQVKSDKKRDGLTKPYFIKLHNWLGADGYAIVYDYLMSYQIPDELNPATDCIEAPETSSTELASTASLGGVEQEIIEAIKQQTEGFRNGWISSSAVDSLLQRCGKDRVIPRSERRDLVTALGYEPHPALPEGICTTPMPDSSRPRLYILRDHPWAVTHLSVDQVRAGYLDAQKQP